MSTATLNVGEYDVIADVVQHYIDGAKSGKGDDMRPAFHVVGHDTGGAVGLILGIEHAPFVEHLVITNSVCYDRFDDDMLDFGHPLRWKPRPIEDLGAVLEESLAAGISRKERLTEEVAGGIIAPWARRKETEFVTQRVGVKRKPNDGTRGSTRRYHGADDDSMGHGRSLAEI